MAASQKALHDFLIEHCEIKYVPAPNGDKIRCYIFNTEDCLLFMAETHVQEMRNAIDQTDDVVDNAKSSGDYSNIIMVYNWQAPDPGMAAIRIPVKLIDSLDDKRAFIILRSLQGIQQDITDGKKRKEELQNLFGDVATIKTSSNLDGERVFVITGKTSVADRRSSAERYAEQVATNLLFNLPKALNARMQKLAPKEARGRFFLEGRDITSRRILPGKNAYTELVITDEGAAIYGDIAAKHAKFRESISKIFRQAMTDPFGFSLRYYMGKHALIKISSSTTEN